MTGIILDLNCENQVILVISSFFTLTSLLPFYIWAFLNNTVLWTRQQLKRETDGLQQNRSEVADLQRQVESLERQVLTKTKEVENQRQEIETSKQAAEAERNSLCENYRKILEEQEFSMDAQVKAYLYCTELYCC